MKGITFYPLCEGYDAFVTDRGEAGESPYSSVNFCGYTGDEETKVAEAYGKVCEAAGVGSIVRLRQIHSAEVAVVGRADDDTGGFDGAVTRLSDVAIGVFTADCVSVVLADSEAGVIGAAHAGWKGALSGIAQAVVTKMTGLGARPERIIAMIGPCICAGCFEVGEEVACRFPDAFVRRDFGPKPHVDLPGYVRQMLIDSGLSDINISGPVGCTRCNPDRYFSARKSGVASGRNFTGIVKRSRPERQ